MKLVHDMPAEAYHADMALSKSGLDQFKKSPAHYRAWRDGLTKPESTPAMEFGSAFHAAVLEPSKFASEYTVFDGDRRTKAGREDYERLQATGVTVLSKDSMDTIKAMQLAVLAHPTARKILGWDIRTEVSVFDLWNDIRVKGRIDILPEGEYAHVLCDLKTTSDASPAGFAKTAAQLRYHVQAAWYLRFFSARLKFIFIAIEKVAPYEVGVYELDTAAIAAGEAEIERQLDMFKSCQDFDSWPGYSTQLQTLSLPSWAFKQDNNNNQ